MNFKEKMTTVCITEKSRKIIKQLTNEIKEKTGNCISVAEFIDEFCKDGAKFCKDKILNEYYTITQDEANQIIKEIDNVSK